MLKWAKTLIDAVARETREETAWMFEPKAISGVYLWQHPEKDERFLRVTFCGQHSAHDNALPLDDGIIRALWLSRDELADGGFKLRSPMVLRSVDDYLANIRYPANMFQQLEVEQLASKAAVV